MQRLIFQKKEEKGVFSVKKSLIFILAVCCSLTAFSAAEKIQVYRAKNDFYVRSSWSETEDIVLCFFRFANERAYLIPKKLPLEKFARSGGRVGAKLLRSSGDDYPATAPLGAYRTLSGNHGSPFARTLRCAGHGLTVKDLGGVMKTSKGTSYIIKQCHHAFPPVMKTSKGTSYIIMQIVDQDRVLVHPEGKNDTMNPGFSPVHPKTKLFYKGKPFSFTESKFTQLYPLNRITDLRLLADGRTPVPEGKTLTCTFLDFHFTHDVIDPYMAVQSVKNNPGKIPSPQWVGKWAMTLVNTPALQKKYDSYMKLRILATYKNHFRFEGRGAYVNYRNAVYHQRLSSVISLDVMAAWYSGLMGKQEKQFFYIPKLKKIKTPPVYGKPGFEFDFTKGIYLYPKMPLSYRITRNESLDPENMPDRFIRVTGTETTPLYGLALGYSLFMGCTGQKASLQLRHDIYYLYRTHKMYPYAYSMKNVPAGKTFDVVAYKQYFNPLLERDASSFYCHHQGKSFVVYLSFHKKLKDKVITLPAEAAGKKITIQEKTPSLVLHTKGTIPADRKIRLDQKADHGYLVLKLD